MSDDITAVSDQNVLDQVEVTPGVSTLEKKFLFDVRRYSETRHLIYHFTTEPKYLKQYYNVREMCYRHDLGLPEFSGEEDHFDKEGQILIVRDGERVVGGGRINSSTLEQRRPLVLEDKELCLENALPELDLAHEQYCEFSRLAVLPAYRIGYCLFEVIRYLTRRSIACNYRYLFAVAPITQARFYQKVHRSMGCDFYVAKHIKLPQKSIYGGIKMCLIVSKMVP